MQTMRRAVFSSDPDRQVGGINRIAILGVSIATLSVVLLLLGCFLSLCWREQSALGGEVEGTSVDFVVKDAPKASTTTPPPSPPQGTDDDPIADAPTTTTTGSALSLFPS